VVKFPSKKENTFRHWIARMYINGHKLQCYLKSLPCDALRAMCKRVVQSSCSLADVDKSPMFQEKENKSYYFRIMYLIYSSLICKTWLRQVEQWIESFYKIQLVGQSSVQIQVFNKN